MSYNAYILIDSGGDELAEIEDMGSYTRNVGAIYRRVLPGPYLGGGKYRGEGEPEPQGGLPGLSGLPCDHAAGLVEAAVKEMLQRQQELKALEPDNGNGSYGGALHYLIAIGVACRKHPKGILAISW